MICRTAIIALTASLAGCATPRTAAEARFPSSEPVQSALDRSGYRLFEVQRDQAGAEVNTFVSPLSIQQAMGLVHAGTRGATAGEIETAFGLPAGAAADAALSAQRAGVTDGTGAVTVNLANALWLSKDVTFQPDFLAAARETYAATAERLDFAGAPQGSADAINGWAARETKGLIRSVVSPDGFNDATVAVLTNAVFFEGQWATKFEQAYPQPFLFGDGHEAPFPLMSETAAWSYAEAAGWKAVRLPYKADAAGVQTPRFVMDVFIPAKRQAGAMLGAGTYAALTASLNKSPPGLVSVTLPRFEIGWKQVVNQTLMNIGIKAAFQPGVGDFSAMVQPGGKRMAISKVNHASKLQVFETGTRAAAVTAVEIITTAARINPVKPKLFRADQPFHLVIRDLGSNTVLFAGRIAKPDVYSGN